MGKKEKCLQDFGGETPKKRDHLEDLGVDVKMDVKQTGWASIVWINLALNTGKEVSNSTKYGKLLTSRGANGFSKTTLFYAVFLSKLHNTFPFTIFHVFKEWVTLFRNFSSVYSFYWVKRTAIPSGSRVPLVWCISLLVSPSAHRQIYRVFTLSSTHRNVRNRCALR